MKHELGKEVVIDEMKICYTATEELKEMLSGICNRQWICGVIFKRTTSQHFRQSFNVFWDEESIRPIATLRFGRYGDEDSEFVFFRLENEVLYDEALIAEVMNIPDRLGLTFHNFTSLDLAIDYRKDVSLLIKRWMRNKEIKTIINGRLIKDRKQVIKNLTLTYSTSLDRVKGLTVTVKQQKALKDKTKGVVVQSYNKGMEIDESSHKDYIREYYGNPQRLYRLEVHLNNQEISDYCKSVGIAHNLEIVSDKQRLLEIYYYHLASVIRFTEGRHPILWEDLLQDNIV